MAATSASSAGSSLDVETERGADNTFAATTSRNRVPLQLEFGYGSLARSHTSHTRTQATQKHRTRKKGRATKRMRRFAQLHPRIIVGTRLRKSTEHARDLREETALESRLGSIRSEAPTRRTFRLRVDDSR